MQQFASDNYSGVCPEVMEYLNKANQSHEPSYGEDKWTAEACELFRETFETNCDVFFVFNGTAANSLSLATYCQPYHSMICSRLAHIETDECGAPEFFSHGSKILLSESDNGKLHYEGIKELVNKRDDVHYPKPKIVSVTQTTEVGTVYNLQELAEIQRATSEFKLKLHMDGARFANAISSLQDKNPSIAAKDLTHKAGVDVLSLGGSKNGLMLGDAVVFFNPEEADEFAYRCKQAGQLASKMRYISAQWLGILKNDTWLKYARHANHCANYLEQELKKIPEILLLFPREANSVFVELPQTVIAAMHQKGWKFYTFIGEGGARLMCSWDTQKETIDIFVKDLKACLIENK